MSNGVVSDLSSEMPSDRVPPGRHYFEGSFRMPVVGWHLMLTAKAPDRSPAAVATGVLALAAVSLIWPAILAIGASRLSPAAWVLPATAAAGAVTMGCLTRFALWYQHGRVRAADLVESEQDPTLRADILIHRQDDDQQHRFEVGRGKATWTAVTWHSSSRSLPGLGMAFLILAAAALLPAAALIWVAALVHAPAAVSVISALAAAAVCAACGTIMMIRIEQIETNFPRESTGNDGLALTSYPATTLLPATGSRPPHRTTEQPAAIEGPLRAIDDGCTNHAGLAGYRGQHPRRSPSTDKVHAQPARNGPNPSSQ